MPIPPKEEDMAVSDEDEMNLRREAIAWVSRLSDRDASAEDRAACERWQAQNPAHARAFQRIYHVWADPKLDEAAEHLAQREHHLLLKSRSVRIHWVRPVLALVACVVLVLLGGLYFDMLTKIQPDYETRVGERRTVRLADQSLVTLNTQSAIAISFEGAVRRVQLLRGEAYFKVQRDPGRPFIVDGQETTTRAIGTEFVVRNQLRSDRVTVIEGVVEVTSSKDRGPTARLTAGDTIATQEGRLGEARTVDLTTASAWLRGLLIVDGVPMAQVIDEVRRYHPGTILLLNRDLGEMRVTGTYKLEEPSKILFHLAKTFPFKSISLTDRVVVLF